MFELLKKLSLLRGGQCGLIIGKLDNLTALGEYLKYHMSNREYIPSETNWKKLWTLLGELEMETKEEFLNLIEREHSTWLMDKYISEVVREKKRVAFNEYIAFLNKAANGSSQ